MATILEATATYLAAQGVGTIGTNLFGGRMPESPDVAVCLFEYEGLPSAETFGDAVDAIQKPRLQALCRAGRDDYAVARDKALTIRGLLGGLMDTTLSGIKVMRLRPVGSVMPLGSDESERPLVSVNFEAWLLP